MKKILHKLRVWLLKLLGSVPREWQEGVIEKIIGDRDSFIGDLNDMLGAYHATVREICRRSESSYYDWCCDYCVGSTDCKRNGWCESFTPRDISDCEG